MPRVRPPSAVVAAALTALAGESFAQPTPVELARNELIRQAEAAALRGDHEAAVGHARRALELRVTPSVQHFVAREHETLGRPLEALAAALACERGAEADRALRSRDAILRACRAIAERTTARVGRVVVQVAGPPPRGLVVRVAGEALPEALLGVPYAVAPGAVRVDAEAPGHEPSRHEVTVEAGRVETVRIALAPPPPPPPPLVPRVDPRPVGPMVVTPPPPAAPRPSRVPWIAVGAGLSALAIGGFVVAGVHYGLGLEARSARDAACASPCDLGSQGYAAAAEQDRLYRGRFAVATGSLVAGAALTVGAALWWVLARPTSRRVTPVAAATPGGGGFAGFAATW